MHASSVFCVRAVANAFVLAAIAFVHFVVQYGTFFKDRLLFGFVLGIARSAASVINLIISL